MLCICKFCCSETSCTREPKVTHSKVFGPSLVEVMLTIFIFLALKTCELFGVVHRPGVIDFPKCVEKGDVSTWLSYEVNNLAEELSNLGYNLMEPDMCHPTMLQARKFVLKRLAKLMVTKVQLEGYICQ